MRHYMGNDDLRKEKSLKERLSKMRGAYEKLYRDDNEE